RLLIKFHLCGNLTNLRGQAGNMQDIELDNEHSEDPIKRQASSLIRKRVGFDIEPKLDALPRNMRPEDSELLLADYVSKLEKQLKDKI
ncbi:MAG: hypothetical protein AAB661_01420, partial [Patescibacteria group bacterium]